MDKAKKERADILLVQRGLAATPLKAQAMILAGQVWCNNQRVDKPGTLVEKGADLGVHPLQREYVSRGGFKLAGALDHFGIRVAGKVCLDIGASTGGFTDCLIQRGASLVIALDVGKSPLAIDLRRHPRVLLLEQMNVRFVQARDLPEAPNLVVADLAFISLVAVLPALVAACRGSCPLAGFATLLLIKPQFELERGCVEKGGVVHRPELREQAVRQVQLCAESLGLETCGTVESPLSGARGNREYFLYSVDPPREEQKSAPAGPDAAAEV